ncbi:MAG: hypothetical protein RH948_04415 [Cyclobacteriaceae bacterium]
MKGLIFSLLLILFIQGCGDSYTIICGAEPCGTVAQVVDKTGLDGCGLMFQLPDGTLLEPEFRTYIQTPTVEQDPLYHFNLKAGQTVKIDWVASKELASICMAGPIVFITCIKEVKGAVE